MVASEARAYIRVYASVVVGELSAPEKAHARRYSLSRAGSRRREPLIGRGARLDAAGVWVAILLLFNSAS